MRRMKSIYVYCKVKLAEELKHFRGELVSCSSFGVYYFLAYSRLDEEERKLRVSLAHSEGMVFNLHVVHAKNYAFERDFCLFYFLSFFFSWLDG